MRQGDPDGLGSDPSETLRELKETVTRSVSELARIELKDVLQAEILLELLKGQRTAHELVEAIYHVGSDHPGYRTYYTKVRRNLTDMRAKGYVSKRLLGKEKPYRMTPLAVARISAISGVGGRKRATPFPRGDIVLYCLSVVLGLVSMILAKGVVVVTGEWFPIVFSIFLLTSGAAITRLYDALRSVA